MDGKLTPKQEQFCREYLIDLNATQAAIRAGYSENTAQEIGSENLSKPMIAARVRELMSARSERTDITADMVLREYAKIAFHNAGKLMSVDGEGLPYIDFSTVTDDDWATVAEVSNEFSPATNSGPAVTKAKVKFHNKLGALDSVAKHLGMFIDRTEHSGSVRLTSDISDADRIAVAKEVAAREAQADE